MRILAIGDIHGSNTALTALLQQVQPGPADQIIFLGDYIDRGPASREVIDSLLELKKTCSTVFLRGNHEEMIFEERDNPFNSTGWKSCGGQETLQSYGADHRRDWVELIPAAHWEFLQETKRLFENDTHIFVHACLDSKLSLQEQPDWRIYWCSFSELQPHPTGKRIICGHTTQESGQIKDVGFAACIDTGAAYGGWLTCLDVNSGEYWQANEKGDSKSGLLKSI
ncbi:MAG: serine/threonine protein phosphatase [Verrucomicrobia bacterium]|nr:serine/threonine protein phosphatase [Verrucomicrobiota bacterium]